jgi:hypothetical protein
MTSGIENKHTFFEILEGALLEGGFDKATLSQGVSGARWKRIVIRPFTNASGEPQIGFDYFDGRQSERKNVGPQAALAEIKLWLPEQLRSAHVRLLDEELIFDVTPAGSYRLKRRPCASITPTQATHNRAKNYLIPSESPFLTALGISNESGIVRRERYDKFRQIQKFIEVIAELIPAELSADTKPFSVVDFGSGKHYLTFALHSYLRSRLGEVQVTGVELRQDLVALGQEIAAATDATGLAFVEGSISSFPLSKMDLVMALHACDTATDDALASAVRAQARYICVAPCCHKYVRQRFTSSEDLRSILRHGILEERFTEGLTDSLRVLSLEALGYQTKLFEFISPEHTAKNVMITARYSGRRNSESHNQLQILKRNFSLSDFYLDAALGDLLREAAR